MWHLHNQRAEFSLGSVRGQLDLEHPEAGITRLSLSNRRDPSSAYALGGICLARIRFPDDVEGHSAPLADRYVRGRDLVASYGPTSIGQFQPQVYWRLSQTQAWNGLELIVSVQTSLLDSRPAVAAESQFPAGEIWLVCGPGSLERQPIETHRLPITRDPANPCQAVLIHVPNHDLTFVEMVHPSDFYRLRLEKLAAGIQVRWELFPEHLEKGVIRRGRLRTGWFSGPPAPAHVHEILKEFASSAPPLTA